MIVDVEALRALLSKATKGPWKADTNHGCKRITAKAWEQHRQAKRMEVVCTPGLYSEEEDMANAKLIVFLRNNADAILAALSRPAAQPDEKGEVDRG